MIYGFGGNIMDMLRQRLGNPGGQPRILPGMPFEGNYNPRGPKGAYPVNILPSGGIPFEGGFNPYGGYKGGGGFPNPLARLQPFLGRRKRPGAVGVLPY